MKKYWMKNSFTENGGLKKAENVQEKLKDLVNLKTTVDQDQISLQESLAEQIVFI